MTKVAVQEGAMPPAAAAGVRQLGLSIWFLPRAGVADTERLLAEFPPDLIVLSAGVGMESLVVRIRRTFPAIPLLVSAPHRADLGLEVAGVDLVIPEDADPVFWMLAIMSLAGPEGRERARTSARTLLTVVEAAHRALASIDVDATRRDALLADLRWRLERSFELLLRIAVERLERAIPGFAGRSSRVAELSRSVARALSLSDAETEAVATAGLLHDVGMHLVTPHQALARAGPLHEAEWETLRSHPMASAAIVSPLLAGEPGATAVREHHERLDGSGYPYGKRGDEVSAGARIVAAADAFEAMTHPRPYREALPVEDALDAVGEQVRQGQLDPEVCRALHAVVTRSA